MFFYQHIYTAAFFCNPPFPQKTPTQLQSDTEVKMCRRLIQMLLTRGVPLVAQTNI